MAYVWVPTSEQLRYLESKQPAFTKARNTPPPKKAQALETFWNGLRGDCEARWATHEDEVRGETKYREEQAHQSSQKPIKKKKKGRKPSGTAEDDGEENVVRAEPLDH